MLALCNAGWLGTESGKAGVGASPGVGPAGARGWAQPNVGGAAAARPGCSDNAGRVWSQRRSCRLLPSKPGSFSKGQKDDGRHAFESVVRLIEPDLLDTRKRDGRSSQWTLWFFFTSLESSDLPARPQAGGDWVRSSSGGRTLQAARTGMHVERGAVFCQSAGTYSEHAPLKTRIQLPRPAALEWQRRPFCIERRLLCRWCCGGWMGVSALFRPDIQAPQTRGGTASKDTRPRPRPRPKLVDSAGACLPTSAWEYMPAWV